MKHKLSTETKLTIQFWLGVMVILAGLVMLFFGIFIPPTGIIDNSILVAFGETATFSGSLIGIDYSYKYKTYKLEKEDEFRRHQHNFNREQERED